MLLIIHQTSLITELVLSAVEQVIQMSNYIIAQTSI